jgi:molybdate/tungstate transport system substrate-binding protein
VMLADNQLVTKLLGGVCDWRIDFATDEMVLGVGVRASNVEAAEKSWPEVVLGESISLARVDENLSPIGYRTLLALKLQERLTGGGLCDRFVAKCQKTVDDVERLPPLLKNGEVDYALMYRSTCVAHAIRYIELDKRVNLASPDIDCSGAEVRFAKLKSGAPETVVMRGAPIVWTLVQPRDAENRAAAVDFVRYFLSRKAGAMDATGFRPLKRPRFYGPPAPFERFRGLAEYGGELK